jgi:hypothetical protein
MRILKDVNRIIGADAVFPPVRPRLHRVPLEPNHPNSV